MIRVLTILATVAALVVPAAHYIDDALGTGVRNLGASVALAAPGVATGEPDASEEVSLVYRGARRGRGRTETACGRPASRPPWVGETSATCC